MRGAKKLALAGTVLLVACVLFLVLSERGTRQPPPAGEASHHAALPVPNKASRYSEPTRPEGPEKPRAWRYEFARGEVLTYRILYKQCTDVGLQGAFLAEEGPSARVVAHEQTRRVDFTLSGELKLTVYRAGKAGYLVGARFAHLKLTPAAEVPPDAMSPQQEELRRQEMYFHLSPRGRIERFHVPEAMSPFAANLCMAVLSACQFVLPETAARGWTSPERDLTGTYTARYVLQKVRGEVLVVRKFAAGYEQVDCLGGGAAGFPHESVRASTETVYEFLAKRGRVLSAEGEARWDLNDPAYPLRVSSRRFISAELHRVGRAPSAGGFSPAYVQSLLFHTQVVGSVPGLPLAQAVSVPQLTEKRPATLQECEPILKRLRALALRNALDAPEALGLREALVEALRDDAHCAHITELILQGKLKECCGIVLGAMADAGTDSAQSALERIAGFEDLPPQVRATAIGSLAFAAQVRGQVASALVKFSSQEDSEVKTASYLSLGILADRLRSKDPSLAGNIVRFLRQQLQSTPQKEQRATLLMALGNTRDEQIVDLLQSYAEENDTQLRCAAYNALGQIESPEALRFLRYAVENDPEERVRLEAVRALSRRSGPAVTSFFLTLATESPKSTIRKEALLYLASQAPEDPPVQEVLREAAAADPDGTVRELAEKLLKSEETQ